MGGQRAAVAVVPPCLARCVRQRKELAVKKASEEASELKVKR